MKIEKQGDLKVASNRLAKVIFSCLFLAACAQSSGITPSSVPTQGKRGQEQQDFSMNNKNPESLVRLAKGFEQSGDMVSALNFYGQASAINPKLLEPWLGIITLLRDGENLIGAHRAFSDARVHHMTDPDLARLGAEIEIARDNATGAITLLAPHMARNDYRITNLLGVASEMMGSPSVARNYYSQALSSGVAGSRITDNMALSFSFYDDHKTAIALLQKNLRSSASSKLSYETLAIIYAMDNQLDAATTIARSVLTDEEVADNYAFYQALPKLSPSMRARAVFTRGIPVESMVHQQNSGQEQREVPSRTYDPSKSELARKLVGGNREEHKVETPPAPTPKPKVIVGSEKKMAEATPEAKSAPVVESYATTPEDLNVKEEIRVDAVEMKADTAEIIEQAEKEPVTQDTPAEIEDLIPEQDPLPAMPVTDNAETVEVATGEEAEGSPDTAVADEITEEIAVQDVSVNKDEPELVPADPHLNSVEEKPESPDAETLSVDDVAAPARDAFRVQVASFNNMPQAQQEWCRISKRVTEAGVEVMPNVRLIGEGDSIIYRLLLGEYDDRAQADATCSALKEQKLGCYVVKGAGQLLPLENTCKRSQATQ